MSAAPCGETRYQPVAFHPWLKLLVRSDHGLKPEALETVICLGTYADGETGEHAHPGIERLCADRRRSKSSVIRDLAAGESSGWIFRRSTGRRRGDGSRLASDYSLTVPSRITESLGVMQGDTLTEPLGVMPEPQGVRSESLGVMQGDTPSFFNHHEDLSLREKDDECCKEKEMPGLAGEASAEEHLAIQDEDEEVDTDSDDDIPGIYWDRFKRAELGAADKLDFWRNDESGEYKPRRMLNVRVGFTPVRMTVRRAIALGLATPPSGKSREQEHDRDVVVTSSVRAPARRNGKGSARYNNTFSIKLGSEDKRGKKTLPRFTRSGNKCYYEPDVVITVDETDLPHGSWRHFWNDLSYPEQQEVMGAIAQRHLSAANLG